ncbi:pantoate--beta-alanine ligase [Bacillus sp. ISL-40]|uniref:pantoate--beta-alanine ligase n=1 Tax=unclassified Bacillus (in: firmicutes) TaxID=185979 RepID=UPI001BEB4697|nr:MULTISPECIES: pantoate--beta-alanine ligase [unclassified Bacillus (in: firmicutes)]MBT2701529.1 pantoate--beta-alanine ligase [Bacillus sp. ISL-40]MBT2724409.1 pantoate--beta-alanine ligase [Bacillus sp. ISL-46]MBT2739547.1 pantoate--beta-alanine ligase [Bacillus sp. ISL-77]
MKVITTIMEMQAIINKHKLQEKSIGFVPTMGFLHEGHLTLLNRARQDNDIVVLSIFVNPLQFGPKEDYAEYPRDLDRDRALAESEMVDFLFHPSVEEMYPNEPSVKVNVRDRTDVLCGKSRPGHFDGVATVITKLFNIIMPTRAYFGKKDAQQVAVLEGLVSDFNIPVELIAVDIVRENDGLAKSSRNVNLLPKERQEAPVLYHSLQAAVAAINEGERNSAKLISMISEMITNESTGTIDYVQIYSYPQLKQLEKLEGTIIIALAVKFTKVRLIDNYITNID